MSNQPVKNDQFSLIMHMCAGAYVLYSAWKIRGAAMEKPLFLIIMILFIIAGGFIAGHAAMRLIKGQYDQPGVEEAEETEAEE